MKEIIKEIIHRIEFEDDFIKFSDLPKDLNDNHYIDLSLANYGEITIYTQREETDEEYNERLERIKNTNDIIRKVRYAQYLKLKEEFEGN